MLSIFFNEINEYRAEIEQLKLQANELLGDTSVLRDQIERLMKENKDSELNTLENKLARTEYDVYRLIDKIDSLTRDTIDKFVIKNIEKRIDKIKQTSLKNIKKVIISPIFWKYAKLSICKLYFPSLDIAKYTDILK